MSYKQYLADLGIECPPDFDPRGCCICCSEAFCKIDELDSHVKRKHPEFYVQWKSILDAWKKEC